MREYGNFYFLTDDVIRDVVYLMNLGNKHLMNLAKKFHTYFKKLCFYHNLMFYLLIKLKTSITFLLSK